LLGIFQQKSLHHLLRAPRHDIFNQAFCFRKP
jgi:hypothetical protein